MSVKSTQWFFVAFIVAGLGFVVFLTNAHATTLGKMTLYFHKEASDANETYGALSLTPPEAAADSAPGTTSSTTTVNATPPTALCEAADGATDIDNERIASAASTGNRCLGSFISMPIGNAISIGTGDTSAITSQLWSSESANQVTTALTVYLYKWDGTTLTIFGTLTCSDPGTSATSCTASATPSANVTFAASNRIVAIVSSNISGSRSSATTAFYYDSSARAATSVTFKYTALSYNSSNKPSLSGSQDDDFTTAAATTSCTTGGVTYNTKWTCQQGSAANTAGAFNAEDTAGSGTGDSSSWLWLRNQTTSTAAVTSDFGSTPSNTFIYQSLPSSYGSGNIRTVVNSTATFGVGSSTPTSPYNHVGLVLWTSNTDYLELEIYSTAATTGTNSINVVLNNSGSLGTAISLNATTSSGIFGEVWLGFSNTSGSWQPQYSTDGTTWNNVGSVVSHGSFSRVGLNAFTKIANPISSYAGAFEWFSYGLAPPSYNQTSYLFYDNTNNVNPTSSFNGGVTTQNSPITLTSKGQQFRLRQLVKTDSSIAANTATNTTHVDSTNSIWSSVALGQDGLPRIDYEDQGTSSYTLKFAQCTNPSCTAANITSINNSTTSVTTGAYAKIAIAADGYARLVYEDSNSQLAFTQCTNADCSTSSTTEVTSDFSAAASFVLGSDGNGRIVYQTGSLTLKFIECTNASCSTSNARVIDNNANGAGASTSIAMGLDGYPRITETYASSSVGIIYIVCSDDPCSTPALSSFDTVSSHDESLQISQSDGFARIAYSANNTLKFAQCINSNCSSPNISTVDSTTNHGYYVNLVLGTDGNGRIVYRDATGSPEYYALCLNAACTSSTLSTLAAVGTMGIAGLALDTSNNPYITYNDGSITSLDLNSPAAQFKLQYAQKASSCSSATYSDVSLSTPIAFYHNLTPTTGSTITYQSGTDPTDTGQTVSAETYEQDSTPIYSPNSWGNSVDGEWDFSLYDNGATAGATYCLRMTEGNGSVFASYNYPSVTTKSAGPTTDQLLRGGKYFSGGIKQPFYWAN